MKVRVDTSIPDDGLTCDPEDYDDAEDIEELTANLEEEARSQYSLIEPEITINRADVKALWDAIQERRTRGAVNP